MGELEKLIREIRDHQIEHGVILRNTEKKIDKMDTDISLLKEENIIQTKDIAENKESLVEHMEQTRLIKQGNELLHKAVDARLDNLEQPKKTRQAITSSLIKYGSIAGAVYAIVRMWDWIAAKGLLEKIF